MLWEVWQNSYSSIIHLSSLLETYLLIYVSFLIYVGTYYFLLSLYYLSFVSVAWLMQDIKSPARLSMITVHGCRSWVNEIRVLQCRLQRIKNSCLSAIMSVSFWRYLVSSPVWGKTSVTEVGRRQLHCVVSPSPPFTFHSLSSTIQSSLFDFQL